MKNDEIIATANTLLDSSITIRISMEDVRAGAGNKLFGRYAHTSTFDLKLTDAMFNLEYLAMNTGSVVENEGGNVFYNEKITSTGAAVILKETAVPIQNNEQVYAYYKPINSDAGYTRTAVSAGNSITLPAGEYCIRYMYTNDDAQKITIPANFIPDTLTVILEANLYSGGSCDVETATQAGKLQIKVPRFMLNGNQELSMTAAGVSQTAIERSALASGCEGCDGEGVYAEIIQIMTNETWADRAAGIIVESALREFAVGTVVNLKPICYAWFNTSAPKQLDNKELKFSIEAGTTGLSLDTDGYTIVGTAAAGEAVVTVWYPKDSSKSEAKFVTTMNIIVE